MFNYKYPNLILPDIEKYWSDEYYIGENFKYDDWRVNPIFDDIDFDLKINIIYWDKIRVYYKNI